MITMFGIADWDSPVQYVAVLGVAAGSIGWIALGADALRRDRISVLTSPTAT